LGEVERMGDPSTQKQDLDRSQAKREEYMPLYTDKPFDLDKFQRRKREGMYVIDLLHIASYLAFIVGIFLGVLVFATGQWIIGMGVVIASVIGGALSLGVAKIIELLDDIKAGNRREDEEY
jgi:hypothetical protein